MGGSHIDIGYDVVAYRIFIKNLVQSSYILRIKVYNIDLKRYLIFHRQVHRRGAERIQHRNLQEGSVIF